jgi:hypothetical protein
MIARPMQAHGKRADVALGAEYGILANFDY